ncbi:MAG: triose-phosphate isomerase [SAR116 cluster bacterium]|nr:triose-phosphate isomerase [SAR116 cluster bacterium]
MIIAANWKMNCLKKDADTLINELIKSDNLFKKSKVIIFPSYSLLTHVYSKIHSSNIKLGAQDCSLFDHGAFTGQVSVEMIIDAGCEYVILGHSERRVMCKETSEEVSKKLFKSFSLGLNTIICVGENLQDREDETYLSVLKNQIKLSLSNFDKFDFNSSNNKLIIAYEPIWAIGTGKVATEEKINEVHVFIKNFIKDHFKTKIDVPVIYGGSVNEDNSNDIFKIDNVDGVLVGGASLKPRTFLKIIKNST